MFALDVTLVPYRVSLLLGLYIKVHPYFVSTGFQFYYFPFLVVFQHNCHLLKFECQPLNWARLGIIADRDCYLHQSSCFGLR